MTTTALHLTAAQALADALPSTTGLTASLASAAIPDAMTSVNAQFVGDLSAKLTLTLADSTDIGLAGGETIIDAPNILTPAMEAAVSTLGNGVLGVVTGGAYPISDGVTFQLTPTGGGEVYGWFVISLEETGENGAREIVDPEKFGRIRDVQMSLSVVIGRTSMSVASLLNLEPGTVVDLDRSAGEPADVLINGRLFGHGEVVVVDQDYAVRMTRVMDVSEAVS